MPSSQSVVTHRASAGIDWQLEVRRQAFAGFCSADSHLPDLEAQPEPCFLYPCAGQIALAVQSVYPHAVTAFSNHLLHIDDTTEAVVFL